MNKILFLSPGPKYGLEKTYSDFCGHMSDDFTGVILTSSESSERGSISGFDIYFVKDKGLNSWRSTVKFFIFSLYFLLKDRLQGNKFDLIVTYDPLKTGLLGVVLSLLTGTKVAVEVNGDYPNPALYFTLGRFWGRFKRWLYVGVESFVLYFADGIKILYPTQLDGFKKIRKKTLIRCFFNFSNADAFKNIREEKEVLFIGFPLHIKGVDILIEAYKGIESKYPDWKLKIMGYYPEGTGLEELIGDSEYIYHHPPVERDVIPSHVGRCGFLVLPSRTEAMGRVLLEAMAAGKARIGSDAGGIPMVVNDGVDGLIFQTEDVDALRHCLKTLISNEDVRLKMGAAGRERFEKDFSERNYFKKIKEYYSAVLHS
ncbi:MAG: glycosyltransferase [Cellvibrionaceae bacterium]